jgi:hypothetical protein
MWRLILKPARGKIASTVHPLLLMTLLATAALIAQRAIGFLHGTVLDSHGSAVPGFHLELTSDRGKCETISNAEGKFDCQVLSGVYVLRSQNHNWLPYRRAAIQIYGLEHKYIFVRPVGRTFILFVGDPPPSVDPSLFYETQDVKDGLNVEVQFETKQTQSGKSIFSGRNTMLSFDDMAVYAAEITCSHPIRTCSTNGLVTVQIGKEQIEGIALELDLENRKLTLAREPKMVRTF